MRVTISKRAWALLAIALAAAAVSAVGAYRLGKRHALRREDFHDLRVNHAADYVRMVDPRSPAVRALARSLGSPENAFLHVRDAVRFNPMTPLLPAGETAERREASCLGKAVLLCSLYRAMGVPPRNVRVVVGELRTPAGAVDHAWVDLELDGVCLQQDPTQLLGSFDFADFSGAGYTRYFVQRERFCFNDRGFAVVSQLNGDRWSPAPSS